MDTRQFETTTTMGCTTTVYGPKETETNIEMQVVVAGEEDMSTLSTRTHAEALDQSCS